MIGLNLEFPVDPDAKSSESGDDSPHPDIELLGAIAFDDQSADVVIIQTFSPQISSCGGQLKVTMKVISLEDQEEIETINTRAG